MYKSMEVYRNSWTNYPHFASGVLALLAAVDALSHVGGMEILPNRLLFLILTGESMGYLGSRQFLVQLQKGSLSNLGIELHLLYGLWRLDLLGKHLTPHFLFISMPLQQLFPHRRLLTLCSHLLLPAL